MRDLSEIVREELGRSEDYRYAYDEEFANTRMATQIKVLRESHDPPLTQRQLAEKAGMKQSRISELENVAYSSWSISTLRRLARALGVRLAFEFESWGELLPDIDRLSRESLVRPSFEHDPVFQTESVWAREEEAEATTDNAKFADIANAIQGTPVATTTTSMAVPADARFILGSSVFANALAIGATGAVLGGISPYTFQIASMLPAMITTQARINEPSNIRDFAAFRAAREASSTDPLTNPNEPLAEAI